MVKGKKNNRSVHRDDVEAVEFRERGGRKKGDLNFIIIHFILVDDSLPRTFNSNIVLNLMRVCVFLTKNDGLLEHQEKYLRRIFVQNFTCKASFWISD